MSDIVVKIHKATRTATPNHNVLGNDNENLQGNIIFEFVDEYVSGQARLEYLISGKKEYVMLTKKDEKYYCPITAAIAKNGKIDMQLVISQGTEEENVPIFKSNMFCVVCNASINAEIEKPDELDEWMDVANSKLNQMDNLDINATQTSNGTNINITDKQGNTSSTEVVNGISCYHKWNGTTLTITSASGTSSANLKGEKGDKGEAGKTPVRGVDYFTQSDINYMINEVLAKIPTSEGVEY